LSTPALNAVAVTKATHLSKRGAMTTSGKRAITIILFGAIFLGIGVTAWWGLRAELEKTFHEFSACSIVAMDHVSLHGRDGNRVVT